MSKVVNFSNLGREGREIRKTFGEGVETIEVYNPSPENKVKIEQIINKYRKSNTDFINIAPEDLILDLLPLTTNIYLDLDRNNEEDMERVKKIIEDPHPTFEDTIIEVKNVVIEIAGRYMDFINSLSKMPKEEIEKLIKNNEIKEERPEEKELRELEEKANTLRQKIKK